MVGGQELLLVGHPGGQPQAKPPSTSYQPGRHQKQPAAQQLGVVGLARSRQSLTSDPDIATNHQQAVLAVSGAPDGADGVGYGGAREAGGGK